jgi:hydroxyacylglutathione hydrolase
MHNRAGVRIQKVKFIKKILLGRRAMIIKALQVGSLGTNCYLVGCPETKEGVVIDPGDEGARIVAEIEKEGLKIKYIINTHGHADHIGANKAVKEATGAQLLLHSQEEAIYKNPSASFADFFEQGEPPEPDRLLEDGDKLKVGELTIEVLATPGHTPGGICLLVNGKHLFSGDTLFEGSIGRTDLPGGSYKQLMQSIKEKLLPLPDETRVYPGHMQMTTIGKEKGKNPYLQ